MDGMTDEIPKSSDELMSERLKELVKIFAKIIEVINDSKKEIIVPMYKKRVIKVTTIIRAP